MAHIMHYSAPQPWAFDVYNHWLDFPLFERYINGKIRYIVFCLGSIVQHCVCEIYPCIYCAPLCSLFIILCLKAFQISVYCWLTTLILQHLRAKPYLNFLGPATQTESKLHTPSHTPSCLPLLCTASSLRVFSSLANPFFPLSHCLYLLPWFTFSTQLFKYLSLVIFH